MVTALVTGGAGGLGRAVASALSARNVPTAIVDIVNAAEAAAGLAAPSGAPVIGIACDITSKAELEQAWKEAEDRLGPVGHVVNNAGFWKPGDLLEVTESDWAASLGVNLTGPFLLSQLAVRNWTQEGRGGSIVHVASSAALRALMDTKAFAYGAAKAGLVGLSTHIAVSFGRQGIRSNVVAPGTFRSPMSAGRLADPAEEARSNAMIPMARVGETDEVASVVAYLLLDAAYVNGVVVPCDGGTVAHM